MYVCVWVSVCVNVCVRERERELNSAMMLVVNDLKVTRCRPWKMKYVESMNKKDPVSVLQQFAFLWQAQHNVKKNFKL